ncbi:unnamed protein product [Phytomonas sp. Hart1]|nr:unnamed protein product [Phytomonas sp. Hart1]|eukprot:CCW70931.1 unnamed protein product [Phytomonas sp. isolate Hart1]
MSLFKGSILEAPGGVNGSRRDFLLNHERLAIEKLALVREMLTNVIARAKVYGDGFQRRRYEGYSPEDVYRAVAILLDEGKADSLQEMLTEMLKDYTMYLTNELNSFAQACGLSNPITNESSSPPEEEEADEEWFGVDLTANKEIPVRCFNFLMDTWESFSFAMEELQLVWSSFVYRYLVKATIYKGIIEATMGFWMDALNEVPAVFEASLEGFMCLLRVDIATDGALPSARTDEAGGGKGDLAAVSGKRAKWGESDAEPPLHRAGDCPTSSQPPPVSGFSGFSTSPSISRFRRFSELLFTSQQYLPRLQPMVVGAVAGFYRSAAAAMLRGGVPAWDYFNYAQQAIRREKARGRAYFPPQTALQIHQIVLRELLGEVGIAVFRRDCAGLLWRDSFCEPRGEDAGGGEPDKDEGIRTLGLVWDLLLRTTQANLDAVVGIFRTNVEKITTALAGKIAGLRRTEAATAAGCHRAVEKLLVFIYLLERAVIECFSTNRTVFRAQIDKGLQAALAEYHSPVAEHLAAFTDAIFKKLERGELPLGELKMKPIASYRPTEFVYRTEDDANSNTIQHSDTNSLAVSREGEAGGEREDPAPARPTSRASLIFTSGNDYFEQIVFASVHFPSNELFGHFYAQHLLRRLLNPGRSINITAERCFLKFFEAVYGSLFAHRFEGMLGDKEKSEDLTERYQLWVSSKGEVSHSPRPDFESPNEETPSTTVENLPPVSAEDFNGLPDLSRMAFHLFFMTTGCWPKFGEILNFRLPASLVRLTRNVELFYQTIRPTRRLAWLHHLAQGSLRAQLTPDGAVWELAGTFLQCLMLLKMDDLSDSPGKSEGAADAPLRPIPILELCQQVGVDLDAPEVARSLMGLCQEGFPLLVRARPGGSTGASSPPSSPGTREQSAATFSSPGKGGSPNGLFKQDYVRLNTAFTCPTPFARMPFQHFMKNGFDDASTASMEEQPWQKFGHFLMISIIKYIKPKGVVKHEELFANILSQKFNFALDEGLIKLTIEKLIDRGIIERSGREEYTYVF